jgi:hypothetical protein
MLTESPLYAVLSLNIKYYQRKVIYRERHVDVVILCLTNCVYCCVYCTRHNQLLPPPSPSIWPVRSGSCVCIYKYFWCADRCTVQWELGQKI